MLNISVQDIISKGLVEPTRNLDKMAVFSPRQFLISVGLGHILSPFKLLITVLWTIAYPIVSQLLNLLDCTYIVVNVLLTPGITLENFEPQFPSPMTSYLLLSPQNCELISVHPERSVSYH